MPAPACFDPDQIHALCQGDPAFARRLAAALVQTNAQDLAELLAAHRAGRARVVADLAHRILGGSHIVGARAVAESALALETRAAAHGLDVDTARGAWRLARRIRELERALGRWLDAPR